MVSVVRTGLVRYRQVCPLALPSVRISGHIGKLYAQLALAYTFISFRNVVVKVIRGNSVVITA